MNKKEKKEIKIFKDFTTKQIIALCIGLFFILFGVAFLVTGLINDYANLTNNPIKIYNDGMMAFFKFGLDFKWFGVFFILLGTVIEAFSLSLASKNEDREKEKSARRKQRLKALEDAKKYLVVDGDIQTTAVNNPKKD